MIPGSSGAPVSGQAQGQAQVRAPMPSAANPMSGIPTVFNDPATAFNALGRINRALAIPGLIPSLAEGDSRGSIGG